MKHIIWFIIICASAVGLALLAADNQASLSVFWPPYRIRLSFNFALLLLTAFFILLYFSIRALSKLWALPEQAKNWRSQYHERLMYAELFNAQSQLFSGRYSRVNKAVESVLSHLAHCHELSASTSAQVQMVAHLLAAEAAHFLRDTASCEKHIALAEEHGSALGQLKEGIALKAATWAIEDQNVAQAREYLLSLPQGAQRRIQALHLKLKVANLSKQPEVAIETARLLNKHGAFPGSIGATLIRSLAIAILDNAFDNAQLQDAWNKLTKSERDIPEVMHHAIARSLSLVQTANSTTESAAINGLLHQLWERYAELSDELKKQFIFTLEKSISKVTHDWLAEIEKAHKQNSHDIGLQYLAAVAYFHFQLWGKSRSLLEAIVRDVSAQKTRPDIVRSSWLYIARLAEHQGDESAALGAWKQAATL